MERDHGPLDVLSRARKLDADAWESLYVAAYPRLISYAARRVGHDHAADVVAETMARAIASIERFDPSGAGFDPWLFGICRNIIGDHFRRTSRDDRRVATQPSSVPDGTDGIERDEEAVAMRTAYERLSDGDRELLDLRVVAGLSADEVAVVLGKLPGTVRMAQSRAVSRLQQHFEEVYR